MNSKWEPPTEMPGRVMARTVLMDAKVVHMMCHKQRTKLIYMTENLFPIPIRTGPI